MGRLREGNTTWRKSPTDKSLLEFADVTELKRHSISKEEVHSCQDQGHQNLGHRRMKKV